MAIRFFSGLPRNSPSTSSTRARLDRIRLHDSEEKNTHLPVVFREKIYECVVSQWMSDYFKLIIPYWAWPMCRFLCACLALRSMKPGLACFHLIVLTMSAPRRGAPRRRRSYMNFFRDLRSIRVEITFFLHDLTVKHMEINLRGRRTFHCVSGRSPWRSSTCWFVAWNCSDLGGT